MYSRRAFIKTSATAAAASLLPSSTLRASLAAASVDQPANIAHARGLLGVPSSLNGPDPKPSEADVTDDRTTPHPCPCCGGRMIIIETFARGCHPTHQPTPIRIDTS